MIEAVENHNPEVIVIDEIGRELKLAARTIAERGVQCRHGTRERAGQPAGQPDLRSGGRDLLCHPF